jgi:hypothetical protein
MPDYQPKIYKFSRDKNTMQWLKDYMAEIDGPWGPGLDLKQVHISACLEGPAPDWYSNDLESRAKTIWPLFPCAFIACWKPYTFNIHTVEVLQNSKIFDWAMDIDKSVGFIQVVFTDSACTGLTMSIEPLIYMPLLIKLIPTIHISQPSPVLSEPIVYGPRDLSGRRSGA